MLVLTRRIDESFVIDDGRVIVRVLAVHGNTVRIGIEAPKEAPILREELWHTEALNQAAAGVEWDTIPRHVQPEVHPWNPPNPS